MKSLTIIFLLGLLSTLTAQAGNTTLQCSQGRGGGLMAYSFSFQVPQEVNGEVILKVYRHLDERDAKTSYGNILKSRNVFKGTIALQAFDVLMVDRWVSTRVIGRIRAKENNNGDWKVFYQPWTWRSDAKGVYYLPDQEYPELEVFCY